MWTCPKCERDLKTPNQWHQCVKVTIDSLFNNKADELLLIFDRLLGEIIEWEDTLVSTTKNCVVFVHNQTFLIIKPMKKEIDLKFYSSNQLTDYSVLKSIPVSKRFENHIRISNIDEVNTELLKHIKHSYRLL